MTPVARLEIRRKAILARAAIRSHELRQWSHARGVWFRLRRLLVDAERVLVVSPEVAQELIDEGCCPSAVGLELSPEKTIFCLDEQRAAALRDAVEIRPVLSGELLGAPHLVLVRFGDRPPTC